MLVILPLPVSGRRAIPAHCGVESRRSAASLGGMMGGLITCVEVMLMPLHDAVAGLDVEVNETVGEDVNEAVDGDADGECGLNREGNGDSFEFEFVALGACGLTKRKRPVLKSAWRKILQAISERRTFRGVVIL